MRERKEPEEEETTVDVGLEVENTIPEKIRQLVSKWLHHILVEKQSTSVP